MKKYKGELMNSIRLIVTDLDFTLLNEHFELSESTKEILSRILESGVEFVPCSSRPLSEIPQWLRQQKKIRWIVTANGGLIVDNQTGETLVSNTLPASKAKALLTLAEPMNPHWSCLIEGHLHSHLAILDDRKALKIAGSYLENILKNRIWESGKDFLDTLPDAQIAKIHFITSRDFPEKKQALIDLLSQEKEISLTSSHPSNLEILHPLANKGDAVRWVMQQLNCTPEEAVACGDNANDLPMLQAVYHSVAVANATDEVLAMARHHALSHREDGAAKMMEQLLRQA